MAERNDYNEIDEQTQKKGNATVGASIAGATAGLLVAGPVGAIVGGVGAAVAAQQKGGVGEATRATGDVVNAAGEKITSYEKKHHVIDKTKKGLKDFDDKHHVGEKSKNAFQSAVNGAKEFDKKHHIVEKTTKGIANTASFLAKKIRGSQDNNSNNDNQYASSQNHGQHRWD